MSHKIAYRNLPQLFLKARGNLMVHFKPILGHFGLTDQQWRILRVLDEYGQLEPRELCDLCQISSPSMAGVLKRMEELDMIRRSPVSGDQRRVSIGLSASGDVLMTEMAPLIDLQYKHIEQSFGLEAMNELVATLEKFNAAAEETVEHVELK
ncbi:homoprotocatechuate degradation operon regulator HpaR [Undibacterium jejuense]|uniref:Homoprotocatechuate degradation operon regulator HpaR n=1 Tax=Undibacterium jejuense TaxID=1344949 RepID=A0A923HFF0_9BURK|nr:homoprotocatechuate degradation operon regulator HpaR [Undibacterium jejuense]MBC3860612.1 homoprotocatechuate degradation operon regulator HpaR [Undibacterium jejuense]